MSAMPAWEFRLTDYELWAVVAYLQVLTHESPEQYGIELPAAKQSAADVAMPVVGSSPNGDHDRGKIALQQYACVTCHEIPGVVGATVPVGPPLSKMARHSFIAGLVVNDPDNMVRWLRAPQELHPHSAMPNLGVTERDAIDISAYLYTLQ